jgi:hypothetical protein
MYAINTGIGALQGKRGSNLFKGAFGDTAMQALTMQALGTGNFMPGGKTPATGMNFASGTTGTTGTIAANSPFAAGQQGALQASRQAMLQKGADPVNKNIFQRAGEGFEKTADFFKRDVTYMGADGSTMTRRETDPVKVGLAAIGGAGALYGLGAFDPKKPDDPKYPGYNRFYAADPSMFMPYDDPDIDPIDYSKYPEGSPYSNMKTGGIASLEDGGLVGLRKKIEKMKKTPEGLRELSKMIPGSVTEFKMGKDNESAFSTNNEVIESYINANTKGIKEGGIASFDEGGPVKNIDLDPAEIFKKIMMEGYRPTQEEKDALDKYLADKESKKAGGIMSLQMGGRASNMPIESVEASTAEEMEMIPPPMGRPSITPREMFQPMMMAKDGALVDKLPSKTNTDENNTANYKRTSGKLVVDAAGKGNEEKDTMLAQLADGEFVTKSKAVRGAGIAMGANPNDKQEQRTLGARFFYKQMADFDKLAKRMSS